MKLQPNVSTALKRHRGFTLIELLIAMALGLAVLVAMGAVYVVAKQSFRFQETSGQMLEDANFAMETIARDLRMAGYAGCSSVTTNTVGAVTTSYPQLGLAASPTAITGPNPLGTVFSGASAADVAIRAKPLAPENFIRGFDSIPATMFTLGSAPASENTDAIYFAAGSPKAIGVSAAMASATSSLTIASDPHGWVGKDYVMVVSDCKSSALFAGKVAVGGLSIDHGTTLGNAADNFPGSYLFGEDAIVTPLEWNFYYVAKRTGAATPSLYRINYDGNTRDGTPLEIVANVESLRFHYGENTKGRDTVTNASCNLSLGGATCAPTYQVDAWRTTAAAVTDWSRVIAVRVGLMVVSADATAGSEVTAPALTLLGVAYTVPASATGTRVRKEYSTTVTLRNRIPVR